MENDCSRRSFNPTETLTNNKGSSKGDIRSRRMSNDPGPLPPSPLPDPIQRREKMSSSNNGSSSNNQRGDIRSRRMSNDPEPLRHLPPPPQPDPIPREELKINIPQFIIPEDHDDGNTVSVITNPRFLKRRD